METKKDKKRVLIIESCSKEQINAAVAAWKEKYEPWVISSIDEGIFLIENEKWDKVVIVSHTHEGNEIRLASEVAALCKEKNIPCVVCAQVTGLKSVIQDFLYRAKDVGASRIFHTKNWRFAIGCNM